MIQIKEEDNLLALKHKILSMPQMKQHSQLVDILFEVEQYKKLILEYSESESERN